MFGGLGWPSRSNTEAAGPPPEHDCSNGDGGDILPVSSGSLDGTDSGNGPSPNSSHGNGNGNGPSHHHSRQPSLDDASMSDLTSTSYQRDSSNHDGSGAIGSSPSSAMMPVLPLLNLQAIRRPPRMTSRLESIPSVGYVTSHEELEDDGPSEHDGGNNVDYGGRQHHHRYHQDDDNDHHDGSGNGRSSSSPQHLQVRLQDDSRNYYNDHHNNSNNNNDLSNADKFSHHLQRYNDHVDKKLYHHHHHSTHKHHQHHVSIQTDVTDTSTVDESYSESDWSTPHSSHSNLASAASHSNLGSVSASRSSSSDTSSTALQGLPHAHVQPHSHGQDALHTIATSFNTSATDGDVDTDEDSLIMMNYHSHSQHSGPQQHHQQQQRQDRPLSPVLPAGSMTNRPPSRRGDRAGSEHRRDRALSPLSISTPRSVVTASTAAAAASATPRARSYHHHRHHQQQQQQQQSQLSSHQNQLSNHHRPPSRTGSISRPRYAVEFRHRPNAATNMMEQQQHPSPVATEAATRAQAQYGRDGRHVERVVMDVDDPYLSHGSSADDLDLHVEEGGSYFHHHHDSRHPHHHSKLRRSDAGLAPLPAPSSATVGMDMHGTSRVTGSAGHGHGGSGKLMSSLFGTLFRTIRTTLLLGAFGAAVTLLRAHFLLASGGAAASIGGGGAAAAAIFGSSAALASQGVAAGGGIAAVRLASGALALPKVTDLLLTAAVREAARAERAVLREKVQRIARMLPDGRPVSAPGSGTTVAAARGGGGRRLSTPDGAASANGETYAVRLSATPGRPDLTDAAVERLARCPSIADVRLDHTSDSKDDGGLLGGWGDAGSIIKRPGLTTDAVLLLADDLAFTCEELDRAFDIWSKDSDRMVGFYTYDLVPTETRSASFGLGEISRGKGAYSVISDRAAFVHRSYLASISAKAAMDAASEWSAKRTEDLSTECDSYALSLAVSAVSSKAPISVAAEPLELRSTSSSSSKQQNSVSSSSAECLLGITSALGMQVLPSEDRVYVGSN